MSPSVDSPLRRLVKLLSLTCPSTTDLLQDRRATRLISLTRPQSRNICYSIALRRGHKPKHPAESIATSNECRWPCECLYKTNESLCGENYTYPTLESLLSGMFSVTNPRQIFRPLLVNAKYKSSLVPGSQVQAINFHGHERRKAISTPLF